MTLNTFNFYRAVLLAFVTLAAGCSEEESTAVKPNSAYALQNQVDKPIDLKQLIVGTSVKKIKGARQVTEDTYFFDFEYFGRVQSFRATVNKEGNIFKYEAELDGSFDSLMSSLEEKLTADNNRPIVFACENTAVKPDSSAEIRHRRCKVVGKTDALTITEMTMQPAAKFAGSSQVPTVITSIELKGSALAAQAQALENAARIESKRIDDARRKKDI